MSQRYAEEKLDTGIFKHNPDLPGTMGENIDLFALGSDFDVDEVLEIMTHEQVHEDSENSQGNRDNILYENYATVSIGLAYDDEALYLVMNFQ
jgi:hypothetical protein